MSSPIHHLLTTKSPFLAKVPTLRERLLEYGRENKYPSISFGKYALGQGRDMWSVILFCDQEMVDALAVAIGMESEQGA